MNGKVATASVVLAALIHAGCAGGDGSSRSPRTEEESAIVVLTRACTPDSCSHYLNVLSELPEDGVLNRGEALEFGDAQGGVFNDAVYIFEFENQRVQRFALNAAGELERGPSLSFQGLGLTVVAGILNAWASPERAFLVDPVSGQIVTWNPSEMAVLGTTNIPESFLSRDGRAIDFTWPSVIGSRVYYNANWYDWDTHQSSAGTALLTFDATVDSPEPSLIEDERCSASSTVAPFAGAGGLVYAIGDGMGGEMTVLGSGEPAQCALRALGGAASFENDYRLDLGEAPDAVAFSVGWPLPGSSAMVAKVWSPAEPASLPLADSDRFFDSNEFSWVIIDTETGDVRPVAGIPQGGWGNLTPLELDGVRYVQNYPPKSRGDAYAEAFLYEVREDGSSTQVMRGGSSGDFEMLGRIHRPER
jgi:hypothetical protein